MSNFTDFFPAPSATIESGTTAQRPASPSSGVARFNTDTKKYELYNGSEWVNLNSLNYRFTSDLNNISSDLTKNYVDETRF
jgi:hypothetical protein